MSSGFVIFNVIRICHLQCHQDFPEMTSCLRKYMKNVFISFVALVCKTRDSN